MNKLFKVYRKGPKMAVFTMKSTYCVIKVIITNVRYLILGGRLYIVVGTFLDTTPKPPIIRLQSVQVFTTQTPTDTKVLIQSVNPLFCGTDTELSVIHKLKKTLLSKVCLSLCSRLDLLLQTLLNKVLGSTTHLHNNILFYV